MSVLKKIYNKAPIFFQNIMTSFAGRRKNKNRYGKHYFEYRKFLEEFDRLTLEEKKNYQYNELKKFLQYAKINSLYYQKLYKEINLNNIKKVEDLKLLPVVKKEDVRQNINEIVTISKKKAVVGHTGGTTGKSLTIYRTKEDMMERMAMLDHFKARVGFEHLKMKRATFNGQHIIPPNQKKKIFWRYNRACKQMIYSSFYINEENIPYYIKSLNKFKPNSIDGFFTCIVDIAQYMERHNIKFEFKPIAVFPTSETLTEHGRELIERVFECKVYDQYASSEGAPFVTECKHQKLHVELASGVFETVDEKTNEIVVTSFTTHGTPLIRYAIGDLMEFEDETIMCECGNESPLVRKIEGRKLDFLYNAEGAKINSGNIANLFKNFPNAIIGAQLKQEKMDKVTIYLEVDKKLYKEEYDKLLLEEFKEKFGNETKATIIHVDKISREKNGKYKMIHNNVKTKKEK